MNPVLSLSCPHCQLRFSLDMPMDEVSAHMLVEHSEVIPPGENIHLDLLPYCPKHGQLLTDDVRVVIPVSGRRERHDYTCPIDHRTYTVFLTPPTTEEKEQ